MSAKNMDRNGRWRNKTIAFRVSPEEDAQLEAMVQISGLTKQDYITRRLLSKEVVINGNPKVFKGLKNQLQAVENELERIVTGGTIEPELIELIQFIGEVLHEMQK